MYPTNVEVVCPRLVMLPLLVSACGEVFVSETGGAEPPAVSTADAAAGTGAGAGDPGSGTGAVGPGGSGGAPGTTSGTGATGGAPGTGAGGCSAVETEVTLAAEADSAFTGEQPNNNYGANMVMKVRPNGALSRRTLVRFDVVGGIPAGAVVTAADLCLTVQAAGGQNVAVAAHRLLAAWTEMQVTWLDRLAGVPWLSAGGEHEPMASATTLVTAGATGEHCWGVGPDAAAFHGGSAPNHGWLLRGESEASTLPNVDFTSRNSSNTAAHPRLRVRYESCP
jgi:hypothetical protein